MTLSEGNTPCTKISRDKKIKDLILKLEFRNPTGSFRDRAASVIVSDAFNKNQKKIVGASTGSFNISLAAYSAKAGINTFFIEINSIFLFHQSSKHFSLSHT